jgi:hypothetical protein
MGASEECDGEVSLKHRAVLFCVVLFLSAANALGQVDVSPHSLYLSPEHSAAEITITSTSDTPLDLILQARDHEGSEAAALDLSCSSWVKLEPTSLRLPAKGSAVIHISIRSKGKSPDGEYHSLLAVSVADDTAASILKTIPLLFRIGEVYSDVKLAGVAVERSTEEVQFLFHLQQLGNAPYRGNLHLKIQDSKGRSILDTTRQIDIYGKGTVRQSLPAATATKGKYKVFMNFNSDRLDLGERAIPVLPKKFTVDISMS